MTHLRDQMLVACSACETQARLEAHFASLRAADGVAQMRLRVPMKAPVSSLGLSLDREVRVEAWRARDDQNLNDLIRVTWGPEGRTVFPRFEGTLLVLGEAQAASSYIELDGAYVLPMGAAGQIFDEAISHRIAGLTAREFLKDLKRAVERG